MGSSSSLPFYVLGSGNGANIATCFAMRYPWHAPHTRLCVPGGCCAHTRAPAAVCKHPPSFLPSFLPSTMGNDPRRVSTTRTPAHDSTPATRRPNPLFLASTPMYAGAPLSPSIPLHPPLLARHHHEFLGLRALVLVNGFLHVDTQLAGILHDSINVFNCTPPSRLDLPLYFFSRFLFSQRCVSARALAAE